MRIKKLLAVALAAALSTLSTTTLTQPKKASAATFTNLNQKQMVTAMGAGWNLGNQLEAANNGTPSETAWGNPTISANLIKAVKNAVVTRDTPDGITSKKLFTMTSSVISLLVASTTLVRRPLERVRVYSRSYIKSSYMVVN